jgi:hypothetical protein
MEIAEEQKMLANLDEAKIRYARKYLEDVIGS